MSEDGNAKVQVPKDSIKPRMELEQVQEVVARLYGIKPGDIKSLPGYDDLNFFFRPATDDAYNKNISALNTDGYVLKVMNSLQSAYPESIDASNALCAHVRKRGIPTPVPVQNKDGRLYSLETFNSTDKDGASQKYGPYLVRLMMYIPGSTFVQTQYVPGSFENIGVASGKLHNAIADGFSHSFYDNYRFLWSLTEMSRLRGFFSAVKDANDIDVVTKVVDAFERDIVPRYSEFTPGVVHGDLNEHNIIVSEVSGQEIVPRDQRVHDVTAIIDWSDVAKSYFVFDIAITIAYLSIECEESKQLDVGGHILKGYTKYRKLNSAEFQSIPLLVCSRLCQTLVYGAHAYSQQPGNEYILTTSKKGWPLLHKYWSADDTKLLNNWTAIIDSN